MRNMNKRTRLVQSSDGAVCVSLDEPDVTTSEFEQAFSKAICKGLETISDTVAPVLRIYLDDAMAIEVGLIKSRMNVKNAKLLEKGLEKVFGFGARVFEKKILENLHANLALETDIPRNFSFSKSVEQAKKQFESRSPTRQKARNDGYGSKARSRSAK